MKASELVKNIRIARAAGRPAIIWGKPGIGKTSILAQCAAADGVAEIVYELPLMDSVDLRGIPSERKGLTYWNPPADLPQDGAGYLCFDDLGQAALSTTNAATRLILEGKLGSYALPEGWWICATSNREDDGATANRMATHVANRFVHFTLEVDATDWVSWAEQHEVDARVVAFIKYRPELLHVFDPKSKEKAFASPRSWEFMSDMLKAADRVTPGVTWEAEERLELIAGVVGKAPGVEFIGFLRLMEKLVSIDSILLDPKKTPVPRDAAILYAVTHALADRVDRKTLAAAVAYVDRLSKEFGFLFMRRIDMLKPDLKKSKEFIAWCAANQNFV